MSDEESTGSDADGAAEEPSDPGAIQRACQRLVGAGRWVAATFKGHSGAGQLKNRER